VLGLRVDDDEKYKGEDDDNARISLVHLK
jgi:hypothetical protein